MTLDIGYITAPPLNLIAVGALLSLGWHIGARAFLGAEQLLDLGLRWAMILQLKFRRWRLERERDRLIRVRVFLTRWLRREAPPTPAQ